MGNDPKFRDGLPRPPSLRDFAAVFFRHGKLFLGTCLAILLVGVIYAVLSVSYTAEMKILMRRSRIDPAVSPTLSATPLLQVGTISEEDLNSQAEILHDQDLLREVALRTGLVNRSSWISWLGHERPEQRTERAVRRLSKNLAARPLRKSQVLLVSYKSPDPNLAAAVLKELGDAYLIRQAEMQRPAGQLSFFDQQVSLSQRALRHAQKELEHFTRRHSIVSAALERDLTLQKLSDAQAAEFGLQSSLAQATGKLQSLDEKLKQLPSRRVAQVRNTDNAQLQEKLKSKLLELELRRTTLLLKFQPSYRLVKEVEQQIAQTKTALEAENLTPLRDELTEDNPDYSWANSERVKTGVDFDALKKQSAVAKDQVAGYRAKASALGQDAILQSELEQKLKAAQERFLLYQGKREEARIGDALDQAGILNVTIAQPPQLPLLPDVPFWVATFLSLGAALVLGTITVFVVDYLDDSLRTPAQISAALGTPVLAAFPAQRSAGKLGAA